MKLLNVLTNNNIIMWSSPYPLQMSMGPDNLVRGITDRRKYVHRDFRYPIMSIMSQSIKSTVRLSHGDKIRYRHNSLNYSALDFTCYVCITLQHVFSRIIIFILSIRTDRPELTL